MDPFFDDGPPWPFVLVSAFMVVVFALFIGLFTFGIVRALWRWNRNNNSPLISVPAEVVARRGHYTPASGDSSSSTSYYVTFQVQGGERREMHLTGSQYGVLVEGDRGELKYQGTRYKGFDRTPQDLPR
jgi:hypothetical protein